MALNVGDWVKLSRLPHKVGKIHVILHSEGTCVVVDPDDDLLTDAERFYGIDPRRIDAWEPATDDDVFNVRFLDPTDAGQWWRCRYCCNGSDKPDFDHERACPVGEALRLRRALEAKDERRLLSDVADFLANEGYPWTANMIRDGSWRRRS